MRPKEYTEREACWACGKLLLLHRPAAYGKGERDRVWCAHCRAWTVPGTGSKGAGAEPNQKDGIVIGVEGEKALGVVREVIRWARTGMK